jgi:host factor-I protein
MGKSINLRFGGECRMENKMNLQDTFLNEARKENALVSIFLISGVQLRGRVKSFDSFTVLLSNEEKSQLIYKHAISTIQRI